jgi:hypothetical protein
MTKKREIVSQIKFVRLGGSETLAIFSVEVSRRYHKFALFIRQFHRRSEHFRVQRRLRSASMVLGIRSVSPVCQKPKNSR